VRREPGNSGIYLRTNSTGSSSLPSRNTKVSVVLALPFLRCKGVDSQGFLSGEDSSLSLNIKKNLMMYSLAKRKLKRFGILIHVTYESVYFGKVGEQTGGEVLLTSRRLRPFDLLI
jgi:hypothetical protein